MKIYEKYNDDGGLIAKVVNTFFHRKLAVKIIKDIPNVKILAEDKRADIFCIFKLGNRVFEIMEFFGGNERYMSGSQKFNTQKN